MKLMKTEYRNRLQASTMTMLLTLQLHAPEISDFDPTQAIAGWFNPRRRFKSKQASVEYHGEVEAIPEPSDLLEEDVAEVDELVGKEFGECGNGDGDSDYGSDVGDFGTVCADLSDEEYMEL